MRRSGCEALPDHEVFPNGDGIGLTEVCQDDELRMRRGRPSRPACEANARLLSEHTVVTAKRRIEETEMKPGGQCSWLWVRSIAESGGLY